MTVYEFERILNAARGFLELDMPEDALEALEDLPSTNCRLHPDVIGVRLLILAKLRQWEPGTELIESVTPTHPLECRAAAGTYLLEQAREMCQKGEYEAAHVSVRILTILYPEGRHLVSKSDELLATLP